MARPYEFSSMTAMIYFEAAARTAGFKYAARELNVTPAAVSHQIKALETDLGCALFRRLNRGVELTEKGAFLFVALQRGFEGISDAVSYLRDRPETVDVTIKTTGAVSSLWLTPKISTFWRKHPETSVSQIVSEVSEQGGRYDISLRYDTKRDTGELWHCLFEDTVIPVATPAFQAEHNIQTAADLQRVPLVQLTRDENNWMSWDDWFAALDLAESRRRSLWVNNYSIALQTVLQDTGAMLGWEALLQQSLDDGRLVRLCPDRVASPVSLYLTVHPRATQKARQFADWLVHNTAA